MYSNKLKGGYAIAILELIRYINCLMAGFASLLGISIALKVVSGSGYAFFVSLTNITIVFTAVFLITGAGNAINDYFDVHIDRINKPHRPIPSGRIKPKQALYFSLALFISGIVISFMINAICGIFAVINSLLLIYYAKNLKLEKFLGNISIGYMTASTFLFGGSVFGIVGIKAVFTVFLLTFLATITREIIKDVEDVKGDKTNEKIKTLPIKIGVDKSKYVIAFIGFTVLLLSPVPYFQSVFGYKYLYFIAIADLFVAFAVFEIVFRNNAAKSSKLFKIGMIIALLSFMEGVI